MKNVNKRVNYKWFTLVELLVIISILAILATIAFLSFSSHSSKARDSTRITDVSSVRKWLELYQIKSGYYPFPDSDPTVWILTWTLNWVEIAYKWIIDDSISRKINISKIPSDPLNSSQNYIYWITYDKKNYQIATVLENTLNMWYINNVYADDLQAKVDWNYEWSLKFWEWCSSYLTNIPSLIYNYSWSISPSWIEFLSNKDNVYFVVDEESNMPYNIWWLWNTKSKNVDRIIKDIYNEQASFTWINLCSIDKTNYTDTFTWNILDSFGWEIEKVEKTLFWDTPTNTPSNNTPIYQDCTFNSIPVLHSTSVTAYLTTSVPYWNTCTSEQRTCNDWVLSGTFTYTGCSVIVPVPSTPIASAATSITTTSITWNWQAVSWATYYEWSKDWITWINKWTSLNHAETGLASSTIYSNRQLRACNEVWCSWIMIFPYVTTKCQRYCRTRTHCSKPGAGLRLNRSSRTTTPWSPTCSNVIYCSTGRTLDILTKDYNCY
ncbi:MAG: hypothetical protein ACD_49C00071G0002 [uncultured bacterium (gcode 4)]|uniref:Uncharacterized protein n=1 Tax=uncultured bacterium (gcode 4) TaxID=1234023 RepID=K2AW93_9BACT|nr:MAG: hypothetical protein ACD_49C00071G0002 [uncultured bacterium (gcode 4)]